MCGPQRSRRPRKVIWLSKEHVRGNHSSRGLSIGVSGETRGAGAAFLLLSGLKLGGLESFCQLERLETFCYVERLESFCPIDLVQ